MAPTTATATSATTNVFLLVGAVVACLLLCLPTTTTALPMPGVVAQALLAARSQPRHLDRRDVSRTTRRHRPRHQHRTQCAQPTDLDAMFQQINENASMLRRVTHNNVLDIPAHEHGRLVSGGVGSEDRECPTNVTLAGGALARRALCPWYNDVFVLPAGYYPPTLLWALCKCERCLNYDANGCYSIRTPVLVLRPAGCFQGLQRYEERIVRVSTGCVCATPKS